MALPKIPLTRAAQVIDFVRHYLGQLQRRMVPAPVAMLEMIVDAWAAQGIPRRSTSASPTHWPTGR